MKHVIVIALIFCISAPAPLYAQQTPRELLAGQPTMEFVEKPVTTLCGDPPAKCFDVDNFKLYLQMRVQYVWLFNAHTTLWPAIEAELKKSAEASREAADVQSRRADRAEAGYDELFDKYEDAVHRATAAESTSIWGGGLPWLIVAAVGGLALGVVAGVYFESRAGAN